MNVEETSRFVDSFWESHVLPALSRYIEIPNQSPLFDPDWEANGHMQRAVELARDWVLAQQIPGSRLQIANEPGRTPLLLLEVDGTGDKSVLLYGHLDKQPAMVGWEEGLGPWTPVRRDGKLYGRGGADDGYAVFAAVAAIKAVKLDGRPHSRFVVLIECCEESGSFDLPYYVEKYASVIGTPGLVVCLDSGCGDYDRLWTTTSLRGSIVGNLVVEVLTEGVHSGDASGIVPSSFRIMRQLLDRIEDSGTGNILPEWLSIEIPPEKLEEARRTAAVLGDDIWKKYPFASGVGPVSQDPVALLLNGTWRPTLSITGQGGLPELLQSGNVLLPKTALKLSIRLPPTLDATDLHARLKELFESDPPYGARVTFDSEKGATGWEAPPLAEWLEKSVERASEKFFGKSAGSMGEGGSIPFMGMLGARFPEAQFFITGVLGPQSNAHGPNEFLHIQAGKNVSSCVSQVLTDFEAL
ncbi:MAG TPA: M20/M25/M40 family metallo-hydrolase [Thermoanaerobaculia bacterium]|nr:M20/M25/M40 family metallo-hydrolase [Thermoanaerobaculia bacterium]